MPIAVIQCEALACLRRTEPSAALIPRAGQARLAYVPAATTDIRTRIATSPSGTQRRQRPPAVPPELSA